MAAKKLWQKGQKTNQVMQRLCTANDPELDTQLIWFDCLGSLAHSQMLKKMGIYTAAEQKRVATELKRIAKLAKQQKILVSDDQEDCHTLIETELTSRIGNLGKKIHTARSRNDQAALMVRLFIRKSLVEISQESFVLLKKIERLFNQQGNLVIPGYTHLQPAMPASVGMWCHAYYEAILRFVKQSLQYYEIINISPLGSGAGFGTSLKIDRSIVANALGFSAYQRSFIDVNNSRGRFEEGFLQVLSGLAFAADKIASDLMLFLSKEFSLLKLGDELKTGSSIMPQKNNPDLVELLRARVASLRSTQVEETLLISKLSCSYHRDLQFTKEPLLRGVRLAKEILLSLNLLFDNISFDAVRAKELLYPELFATYEANRLVKSGVPFRDAYLTVAKSLKENVINAEDYQAELSEPLRETDRGFRKALLEAKSLQSKLSLPIKTERTCERLLV